MLLRDEYIAALAHDHRVVRNNALEILVLCKAGGLDATRQALRAIQEHGFPKAFLMLEHLGGLPLGPGEAALLLDLLGNPDHKVVPNPAVDWLVFNAPADFLDERKTDILQLAKRLQEALPKTFLHDHIKDRIRLARTPPDKLLADLDRLAAEASLDSASEAEPLVELLADLPEFRAELESRADSWLALEIPDADSDDDLDDKNFWTVALGVRIAGKLRLARTVPALVKLLALDSDYTSEWVADALVEMISLETLEAWAARYPDLEWHERLYLSGTCGHISEPGVDAILERLLDKETDPELEERLMIALSMQPTERATKRSARYFRDNPRNSEALAIAENLFTRHTLLGLAHPDLDLWRDEAEMDHDRRARYLHRGFGFPFLPADTDESPLHFEPAAPYIAPDEPGRNDPCPCGSGKKYKKCCLAKAPQ